MISDCTFRRRDVFSIQLRLKTDKHVVIVEIDTRRLPGSVEVYEDKFEQTRKELRLVGRDEIRQVIALENDGFDRAGSGSFNKFVDQVIQNKKVSFRVFW